MPISRAQAKEICTKPELELVEASFPPALNAFTPARLRQKVTRSRKLQDKYRDLLRQQNRAAQDATPTGRGAKTNARTQQKTELFDETRARFEERLQALERQG